MRLTIVPLLVLFLSSTVLGEHQHPLFASASDSEHYEFGWPVKKVAIVGAGAGGLLSYRELTRAGFDVRVFERDSIPGGNWRYTEEVALDAPIPNAPPVVADFEPSLPPDNVNLPYEKVHKGVPEEELARIRRDHYLPRPLWSSLKSNAPSPIQQIRELPWPEGTPWELPRQLLQRYLRSFASFHGLNANDDNPNISYNTRVELVQKREDGKGWTVTLRKYTEPGSNEYKESWWSEDFDAIVVASGRYNAPNFPSIPGCTEWASKYPGTVIHSRQYRHPDKYENKTVLVIGASTSASEISAGINKHAKKVFLSEENGPPSHLPHRITLSRVPPNTTIIGEIKSFHANNGSIELLNGTFVTGIDRIIAGTGFRYSFPFLPQYHNTTFKNDELSPGAIVTDGSHIRSLHLDLVYIEEPTIGFINMNNGMQSFQYGEFASLALAKIWLGHAKLPTKSEMWRIHEERVKAEGGYGKHFMFLGEAKNDARLRYFVSWINEAAEKHGGRQIATPSESLKEIMEIWGQAHYLSKAGDKGFETNSVSEGILNQGTFWDNVFADDW
uniref:FAD/NAD(P)-binding domain-containing protein n=1 Tax=Moniliophthora roreri TaxID=221103 RepID=A0A0W0EY60_MONRR